MVAAMRAREADRLSTLRMMKAAFKNKEIDQRAPLTDAQAAQVLTTLIKQRRDSIEQFTKGNRPELAAKEAAEIVVIEEYLPKAAGEEANPPTGWRCAGRAARPGSDSRDRRIWARP